MQTTTRRSWADLVVLIVGLWTIAQAIWGPMLLPQRSQDRGAASTYVISVVAGGLTLVGMWLAQGRQITLGKALIAAMGAVILIGPFTYQRAAALPTILAAVSGLVLLVASRFVGPLPPPAKDQHSPKTADPPQPGYTDQRGR